jgi:glycosyltransferase involved in cell wall biosynthesis
MKSVLIINPPINLYGGAERQIAELANHLTNKNHKVTIASPFMCPEFKSSLKEARIVETGNEQELLNFVIKYSCKFEIFNPHNHPCELFAPYTQKLNTVWQCNEPPGYVLEGNPVNPQERAYIQATCKKAVVISDFDRARFKSLYGMNADVNNPGIHYDFFAEDVKVRNTLNMKNNFVVTQVGYFTWTKQQKKTIEIFAEIRKENKNCKLVLVGYNAWAKQYPYVRECHELVEKLGLEDDVFISDYLFGDENIRNIYKQSNVCINPTLSQGAYASVFESISAGVPTIVSDDFVASNLIKKNELGIVVAGQRNEDYVSKVFDVMETENAYKEKVKTNKVWIKENLTWKRFGEKYEEIFETVC